MKRLNSLVHWTLLSGVVASGLLLSLGVVLALVRGEPQPVGPPPGLTQMWHDALAGKGVAITYLGLLLLMITPLLRVIVLAAGWAAERNWRFAGVALAVLALLAVSLLLGIG